MPVTSHSYGRRRRVYPRRVVRYTRSCRCIPSTLYPLHPYHFPQAPTSSPPNQKQFCGNTCLNVDRMTPNKLRPDPSHRHPLFQPDKRNLPPPPSPPTAAQSAQRAAPTTFDHILPKQTYSHYSTPSTVSKDASLSSLAPQPSAPELHGSHQSRTKSFFDRFRPSRPGSTEDDHARGLDRQARREPRQTLRERSKQLKAEQKEAEKQERARNQWLGGMAWGFDPAAGQSPRSSTEMKTSYSSMSETGSSRRGTNTPRSSEGSARRVHRTPDTGLESGGPGREGNFEYGILKSVRR